MRFELTEDQRDLAAALEGLLASSDTVAVARAWADGDHGPGQKLWARLSELGVTMLATEATPVEVCVAFEALGRHAVPGPWVESAAYLPIGARPRGRADGHRRRTSARPPRAGRRRGRAGVRRPHAHHRGRRAAHVRRPDPPAVRGHWRRHRSTWDDAFDAAVLAVSAQLLGAGERVLADSVAYVKQRKQFGREIGSYQAIKHALADVRIALDFARPLVFAAALGEISPSAAKVATADAAYLAARTGLQVHGAVGYTAELDLSIWITKIRALVTAWGTPSVHRERLLTEVL